MQATKGSWKLSDQFLQLLIYDSWRTEASTSSGTASRPLRKRKSPCRPVGTRLSFWTKPIP